MGLYIRLNNKFVFKKGANYYLTNIVDKSKWTKLSSNEKESKKKKNVTKQVIALIKKHGSKSNINFKTKPSRKKIRTRRKIISGG